MKAVIGILMDPLSLWEELPYNILEEKILILLVGEQKIMNDTTDSKN